jgi:hypothetical protein
MKEDDEAGDCEESTLEHGCGCGRRYWRRRHQRIFSTMRVIIIWCQRGEDE